MAEEPLLVLRPNLINAFFPTLIKYILRTIFYIAIPLGIVFVITNSIQGKEINLYWVMGTIFLAGIVLSITILIIKVFIFTPHYKYRFYKHHLEVESKLLQIEKKSVPYNKITNIDAKISFWDRLTNAGDLILHTADEKETSDIKLLFLKNPLAVEKQIHHLIKTPK